MHAITHFDGVGKWKHDSKGKSLWYRHHEYRDGEDEEADVILVIRAVPRKIFNYERVDTEANAQHDKRRCREQHS